MVILTSRFTSLVLAFAASVHALPYYPETEALGRTPLPALVPRPNELEAREHRHHHHHHHHHHHKHKHNMRDLEELDPLEDLADDDATEPRVLQRRHSHHGGHSLHREKRKHHYHGTKVYADDPVIISGDHNHVHTHAHNGHAHGHHRHRHGHHRHGHSTKVYADDPLIVSGNGNHVHSHSRKKRSGVCEDINLLEMPHRPVSSLFFDPAWRGFQHSGPGTVVLERDLNWEARKNHHGHRSYHQGKRLELAAFAKRGLLDKLVPLLAPVPGIAGVIDIVGGLSRAVLSEPLASLIISPKPTAGAMGIQSADDEQLPGYSINASNTSSTTMYLVPQDAVRADLGPNEKAVLVAMPMLQTKDNTVKLYCASYDSNSASPSQLSSQPCIYDPGAELETNSSSTHMSQLFAWNIEDGSIGPLGYKQQGLGRIEAAGISSGNYDPAHAGGYVIGAVSSVHAADAGRSGPGQFSMVFRAHPVIQSEPGSLTESTILASNVSRDDQTPSHPFRSADDDLDDQSTSTKSDDDEQDNTGIVQPSDAFSQGEESAIAQDELASSTTIQSPTLVATTISTPTEMQAEIVTSTFTMLVAPTQSSNVADVTDSITTSAAPSPAMT